MPFFFRPGQDVKIFGIVQRPAGRSDNGRVSLGEDTLTATFPGVLAPAGQEEIDQWKQAGHPITHKVVQSVPGVTAPVGGLLKYGDRHFEVQGVINPGELDHFKVYYCMERLDRQ